MAYQRGALKKRRLKAGVTWVLRYRVNRDDGKRIVCSEVGQTLKVWDRATETLIVTLRGSAGPILVVSADGQRIAAGHGNNVKVWDLDREPHETILNVPKDK